MPLYLFLQWIIDKYDLNKQAVDGMVHIEMRKAVYGLPHTGILANKKMRHKLKPHGYLKNKILLNFGIIKHNQCCSRWLWTILV